MAKLGRAAELKGSTRDPGIWRIARRVEWELQSLIEGVTQERTLTPLIGLWTQSKAAMWVQSPAEM